MGGRDGVWGKGGGEGVGCVEWRMGGKDGDGWMDGCQVATVSIYISLKETTILQDGLLGDTSHPLANRALLDVVEVAHHRLTAQVSRR